MIGLVMRMLGLSQLAATALTAFLGTAGIVGAYAVHHHIVYDKGHAAGVADEKERQIAVTRETNRNIGRLNTSAEAVEEEGRRRNAPLMRDAIAAVKPEEPPRTVAAVGDKCPADPGIGAKAIKKLNEVK